MVYGRLVAALVAAVAIGGCARPVNYFQATAPSTGIGTQCEAANGSLRFAADYPDHKRYLFMQVTALPGVPPTLIVVIDKNYHIGLEKQADAKLNAWWIDRRVPFMFSADNISVGWDDGENGTRYTIKGLDPSGKTFEGRPSSNVNDYAFVIEFPLTEFSGDTFDVTLPAVTFEGITVAPPPVRFSRSERTILTPPDC